MSGTYAEPCTWCGVDVEAGNGWRAYEPSGERRAAFCRLEHIVPWAMTGARWEAGASTESAELDSGPMRCAHCEAELGERHVALVRHRGEHRIHDAFCSVDHLNDWAKAGGRWQ